MGKRAKLARVGGCAIAAAVALVSQQSRAADTWLPIYSTDFSINPNWVTNAPSDYYWDPSGGNFRATERDGSQAYASIPVSLSANSSFKLDFDVKVSQLTSVGNFKFGLFNPTRVSYLSQNVNPPTPSTQVFQFTFDHAFTGVSLSGFDSTGTGFLNQGPSQIVSANTPYHVSMNYDYPTRTATATLTNSSNGAVVRTFSASGVAGFTNLSQLGFSKVGSEPANSGEIGVGAIDNVTLYQKLTISDPPPPTKTYTFNTMQAQTSATQKNLIVLVHGINSDPSAWAVGPTNAASWKTALEGKINSATWDVRAYDWSQDASGPSIPSTEMKVAAAVHGQDLATQILAQASIAGYDHVHLIGHSLGGRVIDTATTALRQGNPNLVIQTTFLDAYTPDNWESFFGEKATWADHYYSTAGKTDWLLNLTSKTFANAHNVDVTALQAFYKDTGDGHGWPVRWYKNTIDSFDKATLGSGAVVPYGSYGFQLSKEAGNAAWSSASPAEQLPPRGDTVTFVINPNNLPIPNLWNQPATAPIITTSVGIVDPNTALLDQSVTGLVTTGSGRLGLTTGSPVWANLALITSEEANFIEFNYDFTSNADGQLSVFLDDVLIHRLYERFAFDGPQDSGKIFLDGLLPPGAHVLAFRLDPLTADASSVSITSIGAGFVEVVPEPGSMALLVVGAGGLLLRRRRAA